MERPLLVYTTLPDTQTALAIGEVLVREHLAACVNVLPGIESVYAWKGAIERGQEVVAILKTREGLAEALGAALKARHPYETPIILHLPVTGADPETAAWILAETGGEGAPPQPGSAG
ncbi:divalent-cation tolerance protein CutA [Methylobacterium gnaphalii]|uniref:Divalent-cation tolerance protein CutA n=1 Tax=Methylobacterium gnaphalii TaxID=1010610 RepID=A0A512JHN4_9HYPH|nr:divalent-cation tolerance protein CutA [Methylobacterium gnaphalii]GEP09465.1 divalent-cation tolerance protein CutA [Methylobacterium gnaphalii]GJD68057.1 Divalent-cation tolerance protein CutA [Methylobacterium gnaphalii]GLS51580.1 divalent-cation tolerance protein CutA [Methylobacterium gnaphalii]